MVWYLILLIIPMTFLVNYRWQKQSRKPDYERIAKLEFSIYGQVFTHGGAPSVDVYKIKNPPVIYNPLPTVKTNANCTHPGSAPCWYHGRHIEDTAYACIKCKSLNANYHSPGCPNDRSDPSDTYYITDERNW